MFVNEFLYDVLGETPIKNRKVLRDYLRLNDEQELGIAAKDSNLVAIIEAEKLDLNSLFMQNMEVSKFFDFIKNKSVKDAKCPDF